MDGKDRNKKFGFILKNRKTYELVYFGNLEFAEEAVSPRDAVIWRGNNEDYIKEVDLNIFGEQRIIKLPIKEKESLTNEVDVTEEFIEYISELSVSRIMKEKNFVIWKDLIRNYRLYNTADLFYFVREQKTLEVSGEITDLQVLKEVVAKKEFLDGLLKFRPYRLNGAKIDKPYGEFDLPTQNTKIFGAYTTALRNTYFGGSKYFNLIRPGETYQPWQWKTKLYEGWITSVIAPRRGGKTMYIGERAVEEIFRDKQFFDKPVRVLVIGINKRKNKTIINYILNMSGPYIKNGYLRYDSTKESILYIEKQTKEKKAEKVLGIIDFIGSKDEDAGVGDYADLIIIDECERIKDEIWDDVFPIVTNEGAKAILVSTLNKRSQRTWFYENIIKGEQEELKRSMIGMDPVSVINKMRDTHIQPHIDSGVPYEERIEKANIDDIRKEMMMTRMRTALRFTGNDVDLTTDKEKEIARDNLRKKGDHVFFPEWLGIFPDEVKTYDYESSVKGPDFFHAKRYKYGIVCYDPAEKRDKAAVIWVFWDDVTQKIHVRRTTQLPPNYTFHGDYLKKEKEDQKPLTDTSYFAYDNGGVGQGLEPYFNQVGLRMDLRLKFTAGTVVNKEGNLHKVSKEYLVNLVQNAFEHGQIIISDECTELIGEFDGYKGHYNKDTGNTKYQAEAGFTDDFVSAFMIGVYFILDFMGEKFRIKKTIEQQEEEESYGKLTDEERNKRYLQDLRDGKISAEDFLGGKIEGKRSEVLEKFGY